MDKNNQASANQSGAAVKPAKPNKPTTSTLKNPAVKKKSKSSGGKYDGVKDMLFLIDYLIQNSSREHKVSEAQLRAALFRHKHPGDIRSQRVYSTSIGDGGIAERVSRFLKLFANTNIFSFLKIKKSPEKYSGTQINALKYYAEGPLSESTVRILIDSIAVYPYAEKRITEEIIKELNSITNKFNRNTYDVLKTEATKYFGTYYQNLQEIYHALSTSKTDERGAKLDKKLYNELASDYEDGIMTSKKVSKLQFEYCMYDYDEKRKKIALVTRSIKRDGKDTTIREVNPLMLIWSNGYYYLVTYAYFNNAYHYYNYRVDRMKNVKCLDQNADEFTDNTYLRFGKFDPKKYVAKNPVMYSSPDKINKIVIRCKRFILNNVIDTFGFDINEVKCKGDEVEFAVGNLSGQGVLMFALEYCNFCEILSPVSLRVKMKEYADLMTKKYEANSTDDAK